MATKEEPGPPGTPSLRPLRGGRSGRRPARRRCPLYADVRRGPVGYVEHGAQETAGIEFLWAWQYDPHYPAVHVGARWAGRASDPPLPPDSAVILADNRLWCLACGTPPLPVRARLLGPASALREVAHTAARVWDGDPVEDG